jgi:CheY-like chemotaxis protein
MAESPYDRILREYIFLEADRVDAENKDDHIRVHISKQGKKIKSYKLNLSRRNELDTFLAEKIFTGKKADKPPGSQVRKENSGHIPIVLIVEDDPDQSKILEMMLKDLKYQISIAANGEEALTRAADNTPDLIITDIMMPKMDGVEFIKKLKRNPAYQNIPVLVLTVLADPEKEFDLLNLGIDDYCQKTTRRNILMKRIENLINKHLHSP